MVAYYLTGNSVKGAVFRSIVEEIVGNAKKISLHVVSVYFRPGSLKPSYAESIWCDSQPIL